MCRLQLVVLLGFVMLVPACAAQSATPVAAAHEASAAAQALPKVRQGIKHDEAEVARLQREVVRQESDSQQASKRLQQQDQQIAELRRKLSQLQTKRAAGGS